MFKKILSPILLAAVSLYLCFYIYNNSDDFKIILNLSILEACVLIVIQMLILVWNGKILHFILRSYDIELSFREYTKISTYTSFLNTFFPFKGGLGYRALYLKKKYDLTYSNFTASLAGNYLIVINIIFLIAFLSWFYLTTGKEIQSVSYIFLLGTVASFVMMLIKLPTIELKALSVYNQLVTGWAVMLKNHESIKYVYIYTLLCTLTSSASILLSYKFISPDDINIMDQVLLIKILLLSVSGSIISLFGLTPGSIGIKEVFVMNLTSVVLISKEEILAFMLVDRIACTLGVLLLSLFYFFFLDQKSSKEMLFNNSNA